MNGVPGAARGRHDPCVGGGCGPRARRCAADAGSCSRQSRIEQQRIEQQRIEQQRTEQQRIKH